MSSDKPSHRSWKTIGSQTGGKAGSGTGKSSNPGEDKSTVTVAAPPVNSAPPIWSVFLIL